MASIPQLGQVSIAEAATGRTYICFVKGDWNAAAAGGTPFQCAPGDAQSQFLAADATGRLYVTPDGLTPNTWFTRIPGENVVGVQQAAIANPALTLPAYFGPGPLAA